MISKERLEELIKEGATIWDDEVCEVRLVEDNKHIVNLYNNYLYVANYVTNIAQTSSWWDDYTIGFDNLFETKEDAEWYKEFGCITRTERLELPTWEELFKQDRLLDCYTQEFCIVKNRSFIGVVLLGVDFTNEIVEISIGSDKLFVEKLTKENYTLACRKCKELFL